MNETTSSLIADLVRYINTLDKGCKTVAYMTALLISWKDMDNMQIQKVINETIQALDYYKIIQESTEHIH